MNRMSENEKLLWFAVLFPIFWPFIPVLLICMLVENIGHAYRKWRWATPTPKDRTIAQDAADKRDA